MSTITAETLLEDANYANDDMEVDIPENGDEKVGSAIAPAGNPNNIDVADDLALDESTQLRAMAEVLNVLSPDGTQEKLNEVMNIVRLNKQAKTNNLAHRTALVLARNNNDPLYAKYAKFNGVRLAIRDALFKKYGTKANARARQLISGTAKPLAR